MTTSPDTADQPVALVTGGSQRIGACLARSLHKRGMRIVIHHRHSRDDARQLQTELNAIREHSVILVQGDLLQQGSHEALIKEIIESFGRLDALINNASCFYPTPIGSTDDQQWHELIGLNMKAPFFLAQSAAPWLRKSKGAIVNITDIYAERPLEEHPVYCASKAGLVSLTRSLARELAPDVRVNAVSPGAILWPTSGTDEVSQQRIISRTPLKRLGSPQDIADTVGFLLIDSPFMTGQVLAVDGGRATVP